MLPALNVSGIQSGGVGEKASNTLQTSARAAIDFRLVPAQTPASVRAHVERHLESRGYTIVRDDPDAATRPRSADRQGAVGLRVSGGAHVARLAALARDRELMTAVGQEPLSLPTMGGSLPIYLFQQRDNTPAVILPIANHDNNQHAANENLRLQNLWDAIDLFGALFSGL